MCFKSSRYFFKEAITSIFKNKWVSLASVGVVMVSLLVLGVFGLIVINTQYLAENIKSDLEISVYLESNVDTMQKNSLAEQLSKIKGVDKVSYISKEDALEEMREQFTENDHILSGLEEENPLPDSFRVTIINAEDITAMTELIEPLEYVESVKYGSDIIEKILAITKGARVAGLVLIIGLTIAAVFLIATTIRLSVYARQAEIGIMKYLGATNWFVRWPFVLEGMILGLFGSIIASALLYFSYEVLVGYVQVSLPFMSLVRDNVVLMAIFASLIIIGFVIGIFGSIISVRRFLKV